MQNNKMQNTNAKHLNSKQRMEKAKTKNQKCKIQMRKTNHTQQMKQHNMQTSILFFLYWYLFCTDCLYRFGQILFCTVLFFVQFFSSSFCRTVFLCLQVYHGLFCADFEQWCKIWDQGPDVGSIAAVERGEVLMPQLRKVGDRTTLRLPPRACFLSTPKFVGCEACAL